jgi:hypothetical protein
MSNWEKPPLTTWNKDEELWEIKVGDEITIRFVEDRVYVLGSLVNMRVFYDHVTEERGIEFGPSTVKDEEPETPRGDLNDE